MMNWFISPVYAQDHVPAATLCQLEEMIIGIFDAIWPFVGVAVFAMFIYGGFMWMLSTGDPQRVNKAVSTMLWAFVGLIILALVMVIMGTFESIFGLPQGSLRVLKICK
jgi:hypothetical protein